MGEIRPEIFSKDLEELSRFDNLFLFLQYREFTGHPPSCEFPQPQIALHNYLDRPMVRRRKEWFVVEALDDDIRDA
jgi:hypothetical protein